jgi:phage N-6-adenine-methyltransferase
VSSRGPRPDPRKSRAAKTRPSPGTKPGQKVVPVYHRHQKDEWATPRDRFREWNREFRFTLDAAATASNALCRRFFTADDDALTKKWRGRVWLNPPYSRVAEFVEKAYSEVQDGHASVVVALVPARTDTRWWHDYVIKGEVRFMRGRLKFGDTTNSAPFPSALVIFRAQRGIAHSVSPI